MSNRYKIRDIIKNALQLIRKARESIYSSFSIIQDNEGNLGICDFSDGNNIPINIIFNKESQRFDGNIDLEISKYYNISEEQKEKYQQKLDNFKLDILKTIYNYTHTQTDHGFVIDFDSIVGDIFLKDTVTEAQINKLNKMLKEKNLEQLNITKGENEKYELFKLDTDEYGAVIPNKINIFYVPSDKNFIFDYNRIVSSIQKKSSISDKEIEILNQMLREKNLNSLEINEDNEYKLFYLERYKNGLVNPVGVNGFVKPPEKLIKIYTYNGILRDIILDEKFSTSKKNSINKRTIQILNNIRNDLGLKELTNINGSYVLCQLKLNEHDIPIENLQSCLEPIEVLTKFSDVVSGRITGQDLSNNSEPNATVSTNETVSTISAPIAVVSTTVGSTTIGSTRDIYDEYNEELLNKKGKQMNIYEIFEHVSRIGKGANQEFQPYRDLLNRYIQEINLKKKTNYKENTYKNIYFFVRYSGDKAVYQQSYIPMTKKYKVGTINDKYFEDLNQILNTSKVGFFDQNVDLKNEEIRDFKNEINRKIRTINQTLNKNFSEIQYSNNYNKVYEFIKDNNNEYWIQDIYSPPDKKLTTDNERLNMEIYRYNEILNNLINSNYKTIDRDLASLNGIIENINRSYSKTLLKNTTDKIFRFDRNLCNNWFQDIVEPKTKN